MAFGDYPTTEERKIPYRLIGIIGGGIMLGIVVVGIVLRVVNKGDVVDLNMVQQTEITKMLETCNQAENPVTCKMTLVEQVEKNFETGAMCGELGADADGCYWKAARESENPDLCESIEKESTKQECRESVFYALALTNMDAQQCAKIESDLLRKACNLRFEPPLTSENCLSLGKSTLTCQTVGAIEKATRTQDADLCNILANDEEVAICRSAVPLDDPDFDQLSSYEEAKYGSDPRKADTDGDGFNDGAEVEAGYQPNGPGRLE